MTEEIKDTTAGEDVTPAIATVITDPETGLSAVVSTEDYSPEKFDVDQIMRDAYREAFNTADDEPINLDDISEDPLTEEDVNNFEIGGSEDESMLGGMISESNVSPESIRVLLEIVNRKLKGEKFNIYKELPTDMKGLIDKYVAENQETLGADNISQINAIKKSVAEILIDEFIDNIQLNKTKNDFAKDMEEIYKASSKDIANTAMEYIEERNKQYREAANSIEDPEKKEKLLSILDQIDSARSLDTLKEFAKTCKLKRIEVEKPEARAYNGFISKYKTSNNNIYDIKLAQKVLTRIMSQQYNVTPAQVIAFLVVFCKYVTNMSASVPTEHAYMYYVLYYCALLDSDHSEFFKQNVMEVIENIKARNSFIA